MTVISDKGSTTTDTSDQRPANTLKPPTSPANATSDFNLQASSAQKKVQTLQATAARIATFPEAQNKGGDLSALIAAQLAEAKDVQSSLSDLGKTADQDGVAGEQDWVASQFEAATAVAQGSINSPGVNDPNAAADLHDIQSTLGDSTHGYNGYSHAAPSPGTQDQQAIDFLNGQVQQQGGSGVVSADTLLGGIYVDNADTSPFGIDGKSPSVGNWQQGANGNCSVVSQLAAVAKQDPNALTSHLSKVGSTPDGKNDVYDVKLFVHGAWQNVRVDSSLPNDRSGVQSSDPADKKNMWLPIYEKALAQVSGGYSNINSAWATNMVTGRTQSWRSDASPKDLSNSLDWWQAGSPVTLSTRDFSAQSKPGGGALWFDSQTGEPAAPNAQGAFTLPSTHVLSVQNVSGTGPNRTVTLLNPWNGNSSPGNGTFQVSEQALSKIFGGIVAEDNSAAPTQDGNAPAQISYDTSENPSYDYRN